MRRRREERGSVHFPTRRIRRAAAHEADGGCLSDIAATSAAVEVGTDTEADPPAGRVAETTSDGRRCPGRAAGLRLRPSDAHREVSVLPVSPPAARPASAGTGGYARFGRRGEPTDRGAGAESGAAADSGGVPVPGFAGGKRRCNSAATRPGGTPRLRRATRRW